MARSNFYYQARGESAQNLLLMRLLDEDFTHHIFKGVLGLRAILRLAGHAVNEKRVRRLVRLMSHEPVYLKPHLSVPSQGVALSISICFGTARPRLRTRSGASTLFMCS